MELGGMAKTTHNYWVDKKIINADNNDFAKTCSLDSVAVRNVMKAKRRTYS